MHSGWRRRATAFPALLLAAAMLVAGCGGGGTDASVQDAAGHANDGAAQSRHGGEESIEGFGAEAGGTVRKTIVLAEQGYLNALANRDSPVACSYLSAEVKSSLIQLSGEGRGGPGCATLIQGLLAPSAARVSREQAKGKIVKVRVEGDRGFVVFHAPGAKLYQFTMVREGAWKVSTLASSVLVPRAATLGK